jgi:acetoacetate decarboxylase
MLPPPLDPDERAEVTIDYSLVQAPPGQESVFVPGPYFESGMHVTAKYRGHRGMLQIELPLQEDWGRSKGREAVGYHKKDGEVALARDGQTVRGSLHRRGKLLHRVQTVVTGQVADPLHFIHEAGYGGFLYRYRLNPDWREGPLGDEPVGLWRFGGNDNGYPTGRVEGPGYPRACEVTKTEVEFTDPSVIDPFCEFPVLEILGAAYYEGATPERRVPRAGNGERSMGGPNSVLLASVERKAFEPWAFLAYDRPIYAGKAGAPAGWPESATALRLTPQELRQYRSRKAIELSPVELVDLQWQVDPEIHAQSVPPQLQAGEQPVIRVLALDAQSSDFSTCPFRELWLMSRCLARGEPAWFALAHIVGEGGDVCFGRETFGYPSKLGEVEMNCGTSEFQIRGHRLTRDFFRCRGTAGTASAAPEDRLNLIGIQAPPFRTGMPPAKLIIQPWTIRLSQMRRGDAAQLVMEFPDLEGVGVIGKPDPWFELKPRRLLTASLGRGAMLRGPGRILADFPDFLPYFMERYEGLNSVQEAYAKKSGATFLVNRGKG